MTPATAAIANAIVSPRTSDPPEWFVSVIAAPATPAPTAIPNVSINNVGDSSRASEPYDAPAITASGMTGKAVPIPKPAAIQATAISHNGDPCNTQVATATPTRKIIAPTDTSQPCVRCPMACDCHQEPSAQVSAATEIVTPAAVTDRPRTSVSISGMYESIAANAIDSRNAHSAAAGAPRRAVNVPGCTIRRSAQIVRTSPTTVSSGAAKAPPLRPARNSPAPIITSNASRTGARAASGSGRSRSAG